ncbi:RagB/SusD family nutrient uptake outer membrane protein [Mucilaginibacter limnophilus]|uniref:RagB/SusD family nutrient uptake outer membrane protein n=1 Tax=Mucilaginibacter limnophilus TaxID=1932778 RepID=A0A437MZD4_9SPHI|nr:RagB/SusD family nutrient uptake outer membrane protein [Mucilaginibacter limnophilus]RVU03022.1 RagB/SusD family nutrient uptake outer membrane protein [Mucilaginibacter limnophilus]
MKTLKIYMTVLSVVILSGCSKFLDVEPITQVTDQNFYKTPDDAFKALVGCYDGLQQIWANGMSFPVASEVLSDNTFGGTGASDGFGYQMVDEFDKTRSPADQNMFGDNWIAYYRGIHRCNTLISKLDQIEWGSSNLRATYESEVRFIRAYLYFDMVRLWGNIPLLSVPTDEYVPQSNPEDVYKLIAEDLMFAADNLAATPYTAQNAATYGRVTKWAAQALLARAYLYYTGYYNKPDLAGVIDKAQALAGLESIISTGGFGLVEDFANLWPVSLTKYVGEDNKETIFAIKYTFTSDYDGNTDGNHWMVMFGMREQSIYPYGNGWGGGTVNPKLWNAFSDNDTRKSASIISIAKEALPFTNQSKQREYTGYYVKKYTPLSDKDGNSEAVNHGGVNFMIGQYQDYVSIRYADVLLMAAELGSTNAQTYFDDVRKRAYKANFTALPVTKENIMKERQLEFAFEGHRYWDLLRQGVDYAANNIAQEIVVQNAGVNTNKVIKASNIVQTKGLQQIPYSQITLSNGTLLQNAGW